MNTELTKEGIDFVTCMICGHKRQRIFEHIKHTHKMSTTEYQTKFPGAKIVCQKVAKSCAATKAIFIKKYGEVEGIRKWDKYTNRQREKNKFEYKSEKYGWSEEKFKKFNESRACTRDNFIKRHGLEKGSNLWKRYCERQSYAGCRIEYFIEKYGNEEGTKKYLAINKRKRMTRDNFIQKYGLESGNKRFDEYVEERSKRPSSSKKANIFFEKLIEILPKRERPYMFSGIGKEYGVYLKSNESYIFIDFFDIETNRAIEFFGNYWHANPRFFEKDEEISFPEGRKIIAEEIIKKDNDRLEFLKKERGIDTLVIWEDDVDSNIEMMIEKSKRFIIEGMK